MYRKLLLRRRMLSFAHSGLAYVPFIGDGDIASELYGGFEIYGADIDSERVGTARGRLPGARVIVANCNGWPFPDVDAAFSLADFDSYSEPYPSFRAFWREANKASPLALFFTDGHRQGIMRTGWWHKPDGSKEKLVGTSARRKVYGAYFPRHVKPWFVGCIKPWRAVRFMFYLRGMMLYWGAVVENA